jgi:hypothetical protein
MAEPRDVPPHREGLDESDKLRPYQEPGWRRKAQDGGISQGDISTRALHECIPLSRSGLRKGRHEQHNADKTTLS